MISKCSKLGQKQYNSRDDWVGKAIHWKLCKNLKFDNTNEWYTHKQKSIVESEIHKILLDFQINMDLPILSRRTDLVLINKKKRSCYLMNFAITVNHKNKSK